MKVLLYFLSEKDRTSFRHVLFGRFSKCGFLFVKDQELIRFGTGYDQMYFSRVGPLNPVEYEALELLLLAVSDAEAERLFNTCEACARVRILFNLTDLVLFYASVFRDMKDTPLFECKLLNHAQSVILMLRECLDVDNVLRVVLLDVHSRQTLPETLYERLAVYCRPLTVSGVSGMCSA